MMTPEALREVLDGTPWQATHVGPSCATHDCHSDLTRQVKQFGTLDDVPDFALRSLEQLYALLFQRFEGHEGVVYYGPIALGLSKPGYWGRQMSLRSSELLQVRYAPKDMLSNEDVQVGMIATRTINAVGMAQVSTFIGFRSTGLKETGIGAMECHSRVVGCKGLHVLMAGIFKRHNPLVSGDKLGDVRSTPSAVHDPFGYQALKSASFSIFNKDHKHLAQSSDHHLANSAAPGYSMLSIAGEIVNVHLESVRMRPAEPIAHTKWKEAIGYMRKSVTSERGEEVGDQAIAAAAAIVELLSAETFVSMRANPFFEGALPDRFLGPNGPALGIAMGIRFALNWNRYHMPRPSHADIAANDHLRALINSGPFGPLPFIDAGAYWCIDVVIKGAMSTMHVELEDLRRAKKLPANSRLTTGDDNKLFWQRVGQRVITATFGLGSSCGVSQDGGRYGAPWRLHDPLAVARDKHMADNGCMLEGLDSPIIKIATMGERRTALVKMLTDVERWLRTGAVSGVRMSPDNSVVAPEEQLRQAKLVIGDMLQPHLISSMSAAATGKGSATGVFEVNGEVYNRSVPFDEQIAKKMSANMNLHAMAAAIGDASEMLIHGIMMHWKYNCGTYIVAPTQTAPCTDCEQPVHVLQGIMLHNSYGACTACHSKRCLHCSEVYAQAVCVDTSQYVGKRCRRCGAEPAWVDIHQSVDASGEETVTLHLSQRTPKVVSPASFQSVGPLPKSSKGKGRKGDKGDKPDRR